MQGLAEKSLVSSTTRAESVPERPLSPCAEVLPMAIDTSTQPSLKARLPLLLILKNRMQNFGGSIRRLPLRALNMGAAHWLS